MAEAGDRHDGYLSIKEVAERTGISPSTIRYYDQQFEEFLDIQRGAGRKRLFSPRAVEQLIELRRMLKDQGLSLRQARQALAGDAAPAGAPAAAKSPGPLDQERLGALESRLTQVELQLEQARERAGEMETQLRELRQIQSRTLTLLDSLAGAG